MPTTKLGKWSVGLNAFFLIAVSISCLLVLVLRVFSFDNHWWDMTVAVSFPASIIGLVTGIWAVKKGDHSILIKISIFIGILTVLFILLHSLFIND